MDVFWDTSGIVALLLQEPDTAAAQSAWGQTTRPWCWRWLMVETEAALGRRRAPVAAWSQWRTISAHLICLDLDPAQWSALCAFNRPLRLRASDAAHLFIFDRATSVVPGMSLLTFDREMVAAAGNLALPVLAP